MSLFDSYDESEEIVKAEIGARGLKRLPEIAIVCFKKELIDEIEKRDDFEEYSFMDVCGEKVKIYKTNIDGKDVALYRTFVGGPATVGIMEEIHARGVNKFIFFGSCGTLTSDLEKGAFIIPTEVYRDEGTSYHYMPVSDFVDVETADKIANIFERKDVKYVLTKGWTTDALYKETVNKVKNRLELGCKIVDMECASIMAMASARKIEVYQFFYSDDTLENDKWDMKTLKDDRTFILKESLKIALDVAKQI